MIEWNRLEFTEPALPEFGDYNISRRFHSIIHIPETEHMTLRIYHASLRDFLLDKRDQKNSL